MNRAPRMYHCGDGAEIAWILGRLYRTVCQPQGRKLLAVGISLGGNALLRYLGEHGTGARHLSAAATVSAPLDMRAGGAALSRGFNMVYTRMFLRTLKEKASAKLDQHPGLYDRAAMLASRNLSEFDNLVTAPLHGYRDVLDYWTRASSKPILRDVRVPALVLNARNDPFLPGQHLPGPADVSPDVVLDLAGSQAPGQYAQATAPQPQAQAIGRAHVADTGPVVTVRVPYEHGGLGGEPRHRYHLG